MFRSIIIHIFEQEVNWGEAGGDLNVVMGHCTSCIELFSCKAMFVGQNHCES